MGALDGLKVLDLGLETAGPMVGLFLADHGADVLRVEPRSGDLHAPAEQALWNRGKRKVVLDLRQPEDRVVFMRLAAKADVLIENFLPDTREHFGLTYQALQQVNPRLILCSLPGFSLEHPLASQRAWEGSVSTEAGLYELPDERDPRFFAVPVASATGAVYALNGILAALIARERDGWGQAVVVPLFDAALAAQELATTLTLKPPPVWPSLQWAGTPFIGHRQCGDGRWVFLHLGLAPHLQRFLAALAERRWVSDPEAWVARAPANPTEPRMRDALWFERRLDQLFRTKTAREWESLLVAEGLSCVTSRTTEEWLAHPQPIANGEVAEVQCGTCGTLRQPGVIPKLSLTPGQAGKPPTAVSEPAEIEARWEPQPTPEGARVDAPPLQGVRVLDFSRVIAGPSAVRTLAELGADVIRVDHPRWNPPWATAFRTLYDKGKRSLALDLKDPEAHRALNATVASFRPDVVMHNFRPGVAERIGLGEDVFRATLPSVVYASVSAFGTQGPWGHSPGWEQLVQSATGLQVRYGRDRPELLPIAVTDLTTGLSASLGVLLSLYHRARTGRGQAVHTTLSSVALFLQAPLLYRVEGESSLGTHPLHHFYQLKDGWVFLAADRSRLASVATVRGLRGLDRSPSPVNFLQEHLAKEGLREWRARLEEAGIADRVDLRPRRSRASAMLDPWVMGMGLVKRRQYPDGSVLTEGSSPLRLSRTPVVELGLAPAIGEHTSEILDQSEVEEAPEAIAPLPLLPASSGKAAWALAQAKWAPYVILKRRYHG
ncbi:MAG: CoA transferase [Deltaproteobacteria bacterium]|nr:CoA transferase [Deltaproteobacteria bacterium]